MAGIFHLSAEKLQLHFTVTGLTSGCRVGIVECLLFVSVRLHLLVKVLMRADERLQKDWQRAKMLFTDYVIS